MIEAETEEGVVLHHRHGKCSVGATGKLKLVKPSAADFKVRDKVLNEVVL